MQLENVNCSTFDALAETAAKIAYFNFKWQYSSFIFFNATFFCGVDVFVKSYNKNVIIGQHIYISWFIESTSQFVLFIEDNADLVNKIEWLSKQKLNLAGRYLIICNSETGGGCDETEAVELFWDYRIGNVILIKYDHLHTVNGYTFFQDESCGSGPPQKLEHWDSCIYKDIEDDCQNHMFPLKFENLNRCPLIVSTFQQEPYMMLKDGVATGADGELLKIIIEILNATLVIMTPRQGDGWGRLESNGTWMGSLGDVYYDWANFSMTSASITAHRYENYAMSSNYNTISIVWVTHPPKNEPSYYKLLRPYSEMARYALLVILAMVITIAMCLKLDMLWKSVKEKLHLAPNNIILYSWQMCMGLPMTRLPTNWFYKNSILLWIWYCLLLRTFYQVYLINSLQTDVESTNVYTIEDAIDQGYTYGGGLGLKDYFIEEPTIYENWKTVESIDILPTLYKLSNGSKFVFVMNLETTKIYNADPIINLRVLPQKIVNSPSVIYFKKYSWLVQSMNHVLKHLIEAGIPNKLLQDFISKTYQNKDNVDKKLTLGHLKACFALLFSGWILSTAILIIENIIYIGNKRSNRI